MTAFSATLPDAVVTLDCTGTILTTNPAFCLLARRPASKLVGCPFGFLAGMAHVWADIHKYFSPPTHAKTSCVLLDRVEMLLSWAGERDAYVEVSASTVIERHFSYFVVTLRDIAKLKSFEAAMIEAKVAAEQANATKSDLVAMVAHEIRTAANGVGGLLRLIEQEPNRRRRFDFLKSAQRCSSSLINIVGDILDFTKLEAGKFTVEPRAFDFADLLSTIDAFWRPQIEEKGLRFAIDRSASRAEMVLGDDLRLCQILHNFISNALKHTARGEIRLAIADLGGATRRLVVTDTGGGISEEGQTKLFRPFEQCGGTITTRLKGTGLGLAITRHLVEQMHGRVGVTSLVGTGSSFWIELDLPNEQHLPHSNGPDQPPAPTLRRPYRILIAEDNLVNRMLLKAQLTAQGHDVTFTESGEEAIEATTSEQFDVIILDVMLPGVSGDKAAAQIRRMARQPISTPIIGLTAFTHSELRDYAIDNFDVLLEKGMLARQFGDGLDATINTARRKQIQATPILDQRFLETITVADRAHLLRLFEQELEAALALLGGCLPEDLKVRCHAISGTAANFGAQRVAVLARELSRDAPHQQLTQEIHRDFAQSVLETIREIKTLLSVPPIGARKGL